MEADEHEHEERRSGRGACVGGGKYGTESMKTRAVVQRSKGPKNRQMFLSSVGRNADAQQWYEGSVESKYTRYMYNDDPLRQPGPHTHTHTRSYTPKR